MSKTPENVQVGDGATLCVGSDRSAYTVVKVNKTGKTIHVQRDRAVPTDKHEGVFGNQDYTYERDPDAPVEVFRWRKIGKYQPPGCTSSYGFGLYVGNRDEYYDPHF